MHDYGANKAWRVKVMHETMDIVREGGYFTESKMYVPLPFEDMDAGVYHCQMIQNSNELALPDELYENRASTYVVGNDCLDEAVRLQNQGFNPVVLNMASWTHPGGGYLTGAGAQEESLFRRTNYFEHLVNPDQLPQQQPFRYPFPEFATIYSPGVVLFRATEKEHYYLLETPTFLSFVAAPAYNHPRLIGGRLTEDYAARTKEKIRGILNTGVYFRHDAIVLSALGCGAFANPPEHMAELFKEVITLQFQYRYKKIAFAIVDDHNAGRKHNPDGNFAPFARTFV